MPMRPRTGLRGRRGGENTRYDSSEVGEPNYRGLKNMRLALLANKVGSMLGEWGPRRQGPIIRMRGWGDPLKKKEEYYPCA